MSPPPASPGADELLHCNLDRIVVRHGDPAVGPAEVHKLLLRGSELEAEREYRIGGRLAHLDVVEHLGAGTHRPTGHPFVRTRFYRGRDLDALVADGGALAPAEACAVLLPVARTLAAMHALRAADAPQGLCHGDVKPSNLLRTDATTLLLDFEHAGPAQGPACRGTPGFAGPEAAVGAPLSPAFDVYGLGAALHWLLTARPPRRGLLDGHDPELRLLIEACLMAAPTLRPAASVVAEALAELGPRLAVDPLEPARTALGTGDLRRCRELLAGHGGSDAAAVGAVLRRRERLLQRRPDLLAAAEAPLPAMLEPGSLATRLRLAAAIARRFPRCAAVFAAAATGKQLAGTLLAQSLPLLGELVRAEEFGRAHDRLRDLREVCQVAASLPGALRVPGDGAAHMPSQLQRSPTACLAQEEQRLLGIEFEHRQLLATLHAAEEQLALEDASAVVDRIGAHFGGTSEAVARHRDRLHRLGFYLERIARARTNIDRLHELVPDEDPTALLAFVAECGAAVALPTATDGPGSGAMGLRSLHLALGNLGEEFPALRNRSGPGLESLDRMLTTITDEAWQLLAEAEGKLAVEPVPVRPLALLLGRIDTFRALEAFVDRPGRTRSSLIDRIEWLRLRLEQAQATRDRLARGAEQALAKGHWTTGLFDMERAVTHLDADDGGDRQAARLRQRLAEARQRKEEIEAAARRNRELQTRYVALQDDPASTTGDRLQVLREQRDCLQFLAMHAPKDRSGLYNRDLRDVELRVAQEQSQQAEAEVDLSESLSERLRIAAHALAELETFATTWEPGTELPGRLSRLLDHWRRRQSSLQRESDAVRRAGQQRRLRWTIAGAGGAAVALTALLLQFGGAAFAGGNGPTALAAAASTLPPALRPAAERLLVAVDAAAAQAEPLRQLAAAERAVAEFLDQLPGGADAVDPAARQLAAAAWALAADAARAHPGASAPGSVASAIDAAAERLRRRGLPR